jgi:cytosine/adenosine deaminase-related metal-dependent hydrolase
LCKARKLFTEGIAAAIDEANTSMWESGIQGTGDICNTSDTFQAKKNSSMRYHSFVELFSLRSEDISNVFDSGENLLNQTGQLKLSASLVPHAPYSVPPELFALIREHNEINNSPWCIHNQETISENTMFKSGTGDLFDGFLSMGIEMKWFSVPGKNSLIAISDYFPKNSNLLFVHNTFTSEEDILFLKNSGYFNRSWFCFCAKANLYIENKLPDILMFHHSGCKITIGTDSLASNDTLSVLEEIKTIHQYVPEIAVETLLTGQPAMELIISDGMILDNSVRVLNQV